MHQQNGCFDRESLSFTAPVLQRRLVFVNNPPKCRACLRPVHDIDLDWQIRFCERFAENADFIRYFRPIADEHEIEIRRWLRFSIHT